MEFVEWCKKLNEVSVKNDGFENLVEETGEDAWYDYWEMGYSPEDAYHEDVSYSIEDV